MKDSTTKRRPLLASSIIQRFVLYATLPVIISGAISLLVYARKNYREIQSKNLLHVHSIAEQIESSLNEPRMFLGSIAAIVNDTNWLSYKDIDTLLQKALINNDVFTSIYLLNTNGIVVAAGVSGEMPDSSNTIVGTDFSRQPLLRKARSSSQPLWSPISLSFENDAFSILLAVREGGDLLVGNCSTHFFKKQIDSIISGGDAFTVVLNQGDEILSKSGKGTDHPFVKVPFHSPEVDTNFTFTSGDVKYIGAAVHIKETGWTVLVAQTVAAAYATIRQLLLFFIVLWIVLGLLSAGGGWFMARWFSRLFAYLSHNARRIAQGDYNAQMPKMEHAELEALAENIRSMVTAVREREEQYRELNHETRRNLIFQRTLLEAINVPVVYYKLQGDILGCNTMFESAMGVTRDEMLHFNDLQDAPKPLRRLMKLLKMESDTGARAFEKKLLFADQLIHTVIIHRAPYFLEEGSVDGYICALLDITDHRLTEDAFQRLIQSTVGVHGVDYFHRIVRLLCDWIGCDGALIGELSSNKECRVHSMLLNGLRVDEYSFSLENSPAQQAIDKGFVAITDEVCTQFPHDTELQRLAIRGYAAVPLEADDGTTLGILELFSRSPLKLPPMARGSMDILAAMAASEILRMRAEREQVKLESQLRQMEKMEAIGQLAGGIAHDINNQLGCILGYSDIIQDINQDKSIGDFITKISKSVSRTADLVKKLLAFSRHGNFVMKPVNVTALIHEVVGLLQHSIDKSIALSMVAADGQLFVMGDPSQLQNTLLNLGLNARDAMSEGGTITYEVMKMEIGSEELKKYPACDLGEYVCIRVRDTGCGMAPEVVDRVFEPFFTTKAEGKGTGLGLAAVYGTISSHRGTIEVKSEPGTGTVFTILLPQYSQPLVELEEQKSESTLFGTGTILVIDDEIDIRDTVAITLRKCGFTVITAGDGLEGVQLYIKYSGKIELVILDMVLPGIDGKSTYERLIEIDPAVKVIVVSGFTVDGRVQDVLDHGARSFLQKPFRGADLLRMVADVLGETTQVEG